MELLERRRIQAAGQTAGSDDQAAESDGRAIEAFCLRLLEKNLIVLRGRRGYVMCGYLDLAVSEKLGEAAARITGVSTIDEALAAPIQSVTGAAQKLGLSVGQKVSDALSLIA